MKAPKSLFDRPGRAAGVVAAVIAVSATGAVALVAGTAAADEPGRCTKNVNVRSAPEPTSRIVALCEAGTAVQVAESRAGFVRLTNLGGWAAQEYISVNGKPPAPAERATAPERESEDEDTETRDSRGDRATGDDTAGADAPGENSTDEGEPGASDEGSDEGSGGGSGGGSAGRGLGGLIG